MQIFLTTQVRPHYVHRNTEEKQQLTLDSHMHFYLHKHEHLLPQQTPCMVGLGSKERALGQAAIAKINSNIKNTAFELKRIIGRRWDEADLQVYICMHVYIRESYIRESYIWIERERERERERDETRLISMLHINV